MGLQSETEATWTCPDCGAEVPPQVYEFSSGKRVFPRSYCDCPGGQAKQAADEKERERQEWRELAESLVQHLNIGRYAEFRFSTWDTKRNQPYSANALAAVEDYAGAADERGRNWLYLCGGYGLGKTHLAVSALRKIAATRLWQPHLIVWPELCQATQESWGGNTGESEGALWGRARAAKILLVDDLDKTSTGEWAMGKLYGLINYRAMNEKPTIITANRTIEALKDEWTNSSRQHVRDTGLAVLSRIVGQLRGAVLFEGSDQRWQL